LSATLGGERYRARVVCGEAGVRGALGVTDQSDSDHLIKLSSSAAGTEASRISEKFMSKGLSEIFLLQFGGGGIRNFETRQASDCSTKIVLNSMG
jgi:hypothetical protein